MLSPHEQEKAPLAAEQKKTELFPLLLPMLTAPTLLEALATDVESVITAALDISSF